MEITQKGDRQKKHVIMRIAICALIIFTGWAGMNGLASLKQPPATAINEERAISVRTTTAVSRDYPVTITGYGQARVLTEVTIAPEVSGRVVATHPTLRTGRIIPAGELLFRIDPSDYTAGLKEARAGVAQAERAYNGATDQADGMAQAVSLYPLQIREAQSSLLSARARLAVAETNLARCEIRTSFNARVKSVTLET